MKTLTELRAEQERIRTDLLALADKPDATEEDHTRADDLLATLEQIDAEVAPLAARQARIDAVRTAANAPTNRESTTPDLVVRKSTLDPYADPDAIRTGALSPSEIRTRALAAIEQANDRGRLADDHAQTATLRLEGIGVQSQRAMAKHVLTTGSPEYRAAFEQYVQDPVAYQNRAAMSLTGANGGYLVPFTLDPTVILTNAGSVNPWRQIAQQKTTATNSWNGVTSAGVNASWLAEATEAADASPTFGQISITPQKASAWLYGSYEFQEDSDFAASLPSLLADAKDRLEEAAFATGTGTGQPKGVITAATTTVTTAGVGAYAKADIYALQAAIPARFRGPGARTAIVMNLASINRTRDFDTAGGASFWTNLGNGSPDRVLGWPLYESTTMASTITTGSKIAVAGDFSQFLIVDRIGMEVLYEPMIKGANQRPTGQAGWFAFWRVGSDVAVPAAFRVLVAG